MKTYVAGHRGMVGGAILRKLQARGAETVTRTHAELDLTDQAAVRDFMQTAISWNSLAALSIQ